MTFFEVVGGGHTWPGSPMAALVEGGLGYTTDASTPRSTAGRS